jgi:hypothetical protein
MSARVGKVTNKASSRPGPPRRPDGWLWWWRPRARKKLAVREAAELLNEFGEEAYWLARICARRSRGALGRHWRAVAIEIARRMAERSDETPRATSRNRPASRTSSSRLR